MTAWIADVLIVLGLVVMTLGVYGIVRSGGPPDAPEQSDRTVKVRARSHDGDIIVHRA